MTIELRMLLYACALAVVSVLIAIGGATLQVGLPTLAGNRADMPPVTGWAARAQRAHYNLLESLVLFVGLILVSAMTGRGNALTALGAELFVGARIAYLLVYLAGIPWLRTVCWLAGMAGLAMLFVALL